MARVTVEDCIDKVENRFDLVLLASHRARVISSGAPITIERDNDKNPVVALREIADTTVSPDDLKEELVHSLQKYVEVDEPEQAPVPLIGAVGSTVDADDTEVTVDRMTEEELLRGSKGSRRRRNSRTKRSSRTASCALAGGLLCAPEVERMPNSRERGCVRCIVPSSTCRLIKTDERDLPLLVRFHPRRRFSVTLGQTLSVRSALPSYTCHR